MVKAPGATLALRLLFLGLSRAHLTAVAWPTRTRLWKRFPAPSKEVIPCQVPAFDDRALRAARGCCRRRAAAQQCSGCAERDGPANLRWTAVSHSARSCSRYNAYSPRCRCKRPPPVATQCVHSAPRRSSRAERPREPARAPPGPRRGDRGREPERRQRACMEHAPIMLHVMARVGASSHR